MGFGISNLIQKYTRPALIRYISTNALSKVKKYWGVETIDQAENTMDLVSFMLAEESIKPDVKKSETHNYSSSVTEQALEDGAIVSEHVIQKPISISLGFVETNNTLGGRGGIVGKAMQSIFGSKSTFDKLVEIWENKIICQIITEHKIYNNMVITAMPIKHQAPYKASITVTCDFKQLKFAYPIISIYVGKTEELTKAASGTVSGGFQKAKSISLT